MITYRAQLYDRADELLARLLKAEDRDYRVVLVELVEDVVGELRETEDSGLDTRFPALERWRQTALEHETGPLERAAAWELTALACEQQGANDLVPNCLANAGYALGVRYEHDLSVSR